MNWLGKRNDRKDYRRCESCGERYYLTPIEIGFYRSKDLLPPNRCRLCVKLGGEGTQKRVANY